MNKEEIENIINKSEKIQSLLEDNNRAEAYREFAILLSQLQGVIVSLIEGQIVEEDIIVFIFNDLICALKNKDDVLLIDALQYGMNQLLHEVLDVMEGISYE